MPDPKPLSAPEIGEKLTSIIDNLLDTGDWGSSLFLKASASRLRELRDEAEIMSHKHDHHAAMIKENAELTIIPSGHIQVNIFMYQVDGTNLQSWLRAIKSLAESKIVRPAYKSEEYVQAFIRSKTSAPESHGYITVYVKEDDFYTINPVPVDFLGHELLTLKEKAVKMENIIKFVHANKKCYLVQSGELVYNGELG